MPEILVKAVAAIANFLHKMAAATIAGEKHVLQLVRDFVAEILHLVPNDLPYGDKLFNALNRMEPHFAFEGVVLRENPVTGVLEIYLTRRSETDTAYPGQFHCPGSAIRNGENWETVSERLGRGEFQALIRSVIPLYHAGFFYQEARGWYWSLPVIVELESEPVVGKWYPVDHLPENTVEHHRHQIIPPAVAYWRRRKLYDAGAFLQRIALGYEPVDESGFAVNAEAARSAIAAALALKDPKTPMGTEMYDAHTPHATNISVEGVLIRWKDNVLEVRLPPRPANDNYYRGMVAGLGQGMRISDSGPESALERLTKREFNSPTTYQFVGDVYITDDPRGWYLCLVYIARPAVMPEDHWYPVGDMPESTVRSHREKIVPMAAEFFRTLSRE